MAEQGTSVHGNFIAHEHQECVIPFPDKENPTHKIRYTKIVGSGGFRVILRLLPTALSDSGVPPMLEALGYSQDQSRHLYAAARKSSGLIVVSGPTGSGKSTALKTLMTHSPTRHERIQYSLEDPVEYKIFGVFQISVNDENEMIDALKKVLRGDPDEVMVGEVRSKEMMSMLKNVVLSGHQVMTTIHTPSAIEIIKRITADEMGVPRDILDGRNFLSALVHQRLIATLCDGCKLPAYNAPESIFPSELRTSLTTKFGLDISKMFVANPCGCKQCGGSGANGQTILAEVIRPTQEMRKCFRDGRDGEAEAMWRYTRTHHFDHEDCTGKTFIEHGLYKVSIGLIDPVMLDTLEPLESYEVFPSQIGEKSE